MKKCCTTGGCYSGLFSYILHLQSNYLVSVAEAQTGTGLPWTALRMREFVGSKLMTYLYFEAWGLFLFISMWTFPPVIKTHGMMSTVTQVRSVPRRPAGLFCLNRLGCVGFNSTKQSDVLPHTQKNIITVQGLNNLWYDGRITYILDLCWFLSVLVFDGSHWYMSIFRHNLLIET